MDIQNNQIIDELNDFMQRKLQEIIMNVSSYSSRENYSSNVPYIIGDQMRSYLESFKQIVNYLNYFRIYVSSNLEFPSDINYRIILYWLNQPYHIFLQFPLLTSEISYSVEYVFESESRSLSYEYYTRQFYTYHNNSVLHNIYEEFRNERQGREDDSSLLDEPSDNNHLPNHLFEIE